MYERGIEQVKRQMELILITAPEHKGVLHELMALEPIFHRSEVGTTQHNFEEMMDPSFWEVGASGRRYSREFVLEVLAERAKNPKDDPWKTKDFHCLEIAPDHYLLTYTLHQGERITRRTTIWRRTVEGWKILFHQGTVVEEAV
jgi:hypothetical protein